MEKMQLSIRQTNYADLESLFQFQLDAEANYLAAFTTGNPADKEAYFKKFTKILNDSEINTQTILLGEVVVGSIAKFVLDGKAEITYWLDKQHWGKGLATAALRAFLTIEQARPIIGRVAFDNVGSQKILEKCGFVKIGTDKGFAKARQVEVEEFIYKLA